MQRTKEWADLAKSLLTSLAILIGGGWALYTFVLTERPQALVDIEILKEHCLERGSLDIKIIDNKKSYPQLKGAIFGAVEIKNVGTRPVLLDISQRPPIRISTVEFDEGVIKQKTILKAFDLEFFRAPSEISVAAGQMSGLQPIDKISILPGRTVSESFVAKVTSSGWYMIDFWGGPRDIGADDETCRKYRESGKNFVWEATSIFLVD